MPGSSVRVLRAKGNVRNKSNGRDVVFTGPRMRVCYSGCRWNTVVFAMDDNQAEFEDWLYKIHQSLEESVKADHMFFKVSPRSTPLFNKFIVEPASNPELYSPELRCRLSTVRVDSVAEPVSTAHLSDKNTNIKLDPHEIVSGSYMRPVFKLGYYKEGDNFCLSLTVLKGECEPNPITQMTNDAWEMDTSES